ncbi:formylglycine-generating enzyme family protein [Mycetocola zhujimingii]|uniref:formylglycine-generating enzyme family protein n=1 Tax=Mycetocola zhujimingii TaxID=2079792 RepID=UPI001E600190|nr:formylglycine-generating enzyme family protein [Mycetocola zhujimingii]
MAMSVAIGVDMVRIPGGTFVMGSDSFYPEEAPAHRATVAAFDLDRHPVTNRQFAEFVDATGYVTVAERALDAAEYPQLSEADRAAGSLSFRATDGPVDLRNWRAWWSWQTGASWRHPFGPESDIDGREDHPVVQVCFTDASAYAAWAGKRLPTEVEWERAARGGVDGLDYAWGSELAPDGRLLANTWQGSFPYRNTGAHGWVGTSPVGTFPANEFGLVDMIGNVWEWTTSVFTPDHRARRAMATNLLGTAAASASAGGCGDGCMCGPSDSGTGMRSADSSPMPGGVSTSSASGASAAGAVSGAAAAVPAGSAAGGSTAGSSAASTDGLAQAAPVVAGQPAGAPNPAVSHVTKGGSHLCAPEYCMRYRPAARSPQTEDSATTHLGFRCARDV